MKHLWKTIVLLGAVMAFASCEEEIDPGNEVYPGIEENATAIFNVVNGAAETKGAAAKPVEAELIDTIPFTDDETGEEMFLEIRAIDMNAASANGVATKGTPVYTENFFGLTPSVTGYAYTADMTKGKAVTYSLTNNPLRVIYNGEASGDMLYFFTAVDGGASLAQAGVGTPVYSAGTDGKGVIDFDYTSPAAAADQKDVLFSSKFMADGKTTGNVLFYHALTGVKFKAGNYGDNITTINSITLSGLKDSGHCTVTPTFEQDGYSFDRSDNSKPEVNKSTAVSYWDTEKLSNSEGNPTGTFALTGMTDESVHSAAEGQFPDSFYGDKTTNNLAENNFMDEDFENTFFFVPQTFAANTVKVTIEYTLKQRKQVVNGNTVSYELTGERKGKKSLYLPAQEWKAGQIYTFTLTTKVIDVYVDDIMTGESGTEGTTKTDVKIYNTGNDDAYIRIAIVGSIQDEFGNVLGEIEPWQLGNFAIDSNWILGDDGFYYYKYIVGPDKAVKNPPFNKYEYALKPLGYYMPGGLVMDIVAQAIDIDKINLSGANVQWGWEVKHFTSEKEQ